MGAAASTGVAASTKASTHEDLVAALSALPPESLAKLSKAISAATPKAGAVSKVKTIFMAIDKDGSGFVVRTELEDAMSKIGEDVEKLLGMKKTISLMQDLGVADKDGDNKISWAEFQQLCGKSAALDMFDVIDADQSGSITRAELEAKLPKDPDLEKLLGMKKTIDLMRDLQVGDTNGDGKISRDEFKQLVTK